MPDRTIEERLASLEEEVARLRQRSQVADLTPAMPWWKLWEGAFAEDPMFEEAMRLGAEYRRSLVPSPDGDVLA